jgi:hypothetical protein
MIKLIVEYNTLHVAAEDIHSPEVTEWLGEGESALLHYTNKFGEPFTVTYKDGLGDNGKADLAISLFDARETGTIPDVREVELPDGEVFVIDEDHGQEARLKDNNPEW